jgi:hypothetical protein
MKIFLIILALLLVFFVVGIALGARDDDGGPVNPKDFGWLDSLTRPFRPVVETGSFQGSCLSDRTAALSAIAPCQIDVAGADAEVRTLELALEQGSEVAVQFVPRGGGLDIDSKLHSDRSVRLSVPREGAALTLLCTAGECRVRLD